MKDLNVQNVGVSTLVEARTSEVLSDIAHDGVAATIWQRSGLTPLLEGLANTPADTLPQVRCVVATAQVGNTVLRACEASGLGDAALRDLLAADVQRLALIVSDILKNREIALRLEPVTTDGCTRFHVDYLKARLICTYRGPGTQLALPGDENAPHNMRTGDVMLMRGARWCVTESVLLRHRSPPLPTGEKARLVLALDFPQASDDL